jgi:hypothetical protein
MPGIQGEAAGRLISFVRFTARTFLLDPQATTGHPTFVIGIRTPDD